MRPFFNQFTAIIGLAFQSLRATPGSHAAVGLGVLVATITICSSLLYAQAVSLAVLRDRLAAAHAEATFDLLVKGESRRMDAGIYGAMDQLIRTEMAGRVGLPLTRVGRHGWSKSLTVVAPSAAQSGQYVQLPTARIQFYSNLADSVEVEEGEMARPAANPQDVVEVMATSKLAQTLGLRVGDEFRIIQPTGARQPMQLTARLTGLIRLPEDPERSGGLYASWFLDEALTVPEATFFNAVAPTFAPQDAEVTWVANFDETAIAGDDVSHILAGLDVLRFNLTSALDNLQFLTNLDTALSDFQRSVFLLTALLLVLGAPVIGIALYYLLLSAGLLVQQRQSEIAVIKSRGGSDGQVLALFLVEGLVIVGLVALIAPFLAAPLARMIGHTTTFLEFGNPRVIPATLQPQLFGNAAIVALLALVAILAPTSQAARQTIVSYRRLTARDGRRLFIHRYYLDVVMLILGGWGYWTLHRSGVIINRSAAGGLEFNPLLLVTPIVLVAALAFLSLRVTPFLLGGLARLVALSNAVTPLLGLREVARTTVRYTGLILILVFTLALGLFTATIASAFDRNYSDQALYAAGADLRVHEFNYDTASWQVRPLEEYLAAPGVVDGSPAARVRLVGRQAQIAAKGILLGIEPESFERIAWWRADFAPPGAADGTLSVALAPLANDPRAVLADGAFIRRHGLQMGEVFDIDIDGERVDFMLAGEIGYFPTLYPTDGDRLIARLDHLERARNLGANEVWLETQARQHSQAVAGLKAMPGNTLVVVEDGRELAGVRKDDPVRTGLFGALSLGFMAASVLSVLGFMLYAYLSIQARALQFGVLRATGLSTAQLIGSLATEQLTVVAVGLVLGTLLGAGAGWMFTRFLQLSIIARDAVPTFLVEIPWTAILRLYGILVVVFGAALILSVFILRRLRVAVVLRLGEQ